MPTKQMISLVFKLGSLCFCLRDKYLKHHYTMI